jgi:hypothetical protein
MLDGASDRSVTLVNQRIRPQANCMPYAGCTSTHASGTVGSEYMTKTHFRSIGRASYTHGHGGTVMRTDIREAILDAVDRRLARIRASIGLRLYPLERIVSRKVIHADRYAGLERTDMVPPSHWQEQNISR